jgi:hypothetical protein
MNTYLNAENLTNELLQKYGKRVKWTLIMELADVCSAKIIKNSLNNYILCQDKSQGILALWLLDIETGKQE